MSSNSIVISDKEMISGLIGGVDFGHDLYCIARSPDAMLVWSPGGTYWSGRMSHYAESVLYLFLNRRQSNWGMVGGRRDYERIGREGGRLTRDRITAVADRLAAVFGAEAATAIEEAVAARKTLIVDGGGRIPCPSRKVGHEALNRWTDSHVAEAKEGMIGI